MTTATNTCSDLWRPCRREAEGTGATWNAVRTAVGRRLDARISTLTSCPDGPRRQAWDGRWPGEADCERLGFFVGGDRRSLTSIACSRNVTEPVDRNFRPECGSPIISDVA